MNKNIDFNNDNDATEMSSEDRASLALGNFSNFCNDATFPFENTYCLEHFNPSERLACLIMGRTSGGNTSLASRSYLEDDNNGYIIG